MKWNEIIFIVKTGTRAELKLDAAIRGGLDNNHDQRGTTDLSIFIQILMMIDKHNQCHFLCYLTYQMNGNELENNK